MELLLKFSNPSIMFIFPEYGSEPKIKGSLILPFDLISFHFLDQFLQNLFLKEF